MGYKELWMNKKYSKGPLLVLEVFRSIIGVLIIGLLVDKLFSAIIAVLIIVPVFILVMLVFSKRIQKFYHRLEVRFLSNLNARESDEAEKSDTQNVLSKQFNSQTDPSLWDVHLVDMIVVQNALNIGKSLLELSWREHYGINIAYIRRGDNLIYAPGRNSKLHAFDHVGVLGTDEQIQEFKTIFETTEEIDSSGHELKDIIVQKIIVNEHNKLKGLTIRDSYIRELTSGLIVGIERNKEENNKPRFKHYF